MGPDKGEKQISKRRRWLLQIDSLPLYPFIHLAHFLQMLQFYVQKRTAVEGENAAFYLFGWDEQMLKGRKGNETTQFCCPSL
jgi:hypothetical protein